jgi:hypothetical protein
MATEFSMKFTDRSREAIVCMTEAAREAMASFGWSKPDLTPMPVTEETEPKAE